MSNWVKLEETNDWILYDDQGENALAEIHKFDHSGFFVSLIYHPDVEQWGSISMYPNLASAKRAVEYMVANPIFAEDWDV